MSDNFNDRFGALSEASDLLDDSVLLIDLTLGDNPGPEQSRLLWMERDQLVREKAVVEMKIVSLLDSSAVDAPNPSQVREISALTADVERFIRAARTAAATVALTNRVFELVNKISAAPVAA